MTNCVWYISKYFGLPESRVGSRGFKLLREFPALGVHPFVISANSSHLVVNRQFAEDWQIETLDGVEICWLKLRRYKGAKSFGRILSWIEFEWKLFRLPKQRLPRPSAIVVSSLSLFTIFNGFLLKARYRCRLIFEVRDIWPLTLVEEGGFGRYNPLILLLGWIEQVAYRNSDAIIGTMPNLKAHVDQVAGATGPVHCVPMGIDDDEILEQQPLPDNYHAKHIPTGKFIICHAGTIGKTNALDVFFETALLMQSDADIHFLLVGDGDLKPYYEAAYDRLPNVSFAPAVQKGQVQSVLNFCDVTYFSTYPSRIWDYGLSLNKLIDYMLAGRPIIGSYSGYPSMLNESGGGSFVPASDAEALRAEILRYASLDPAERQRIGSAARAWIIANRQYRDLAKSFIKILMPVPLGHA